MRQAFSTELLVYRPPTTPWLAAMGPQLPPITHARAAKLIKRACDRHTDIATNARLKTYAQLLRYDNESPAFINVLYTIEPRTDVPSILFHAVVAPRTAWIFAAVAGGTFCCEGEGYALDVRYDGDSPCVEDMAPILTPVDTSSLAGIATEDHDSVVAWINADEARAAAYVAFVCAWRPDMDAEEMHALAALHAC